MPNRDSVNGFSIAQEFSQPIIRRFSIDSSNGTAVFTGDAVANNAAGSVRPATAGIGSQLVGVVCALFDSEGISIGHPNSSTATKYLAASTAGYADVILALPHMIFKGQSQTGTSYAAVDVWQGVNLIAGSGNTTTARSAHELGALGGTDFQIIGKVDYPGNDWGSENVDVYFRFLSSVWGQINPTGGV